MIFLRFFFISFLFVSLLTSCGYKFASGTPENYRIGVPFIDGDRTGEMTTALVREISASGNFRYAPCDPNVLLLVKLIEISDENIGFRYDQDNQGNLVDSTIADETRLKAVAEITLINASTEEILLGPSLIAASIDVNYDDNDSGDNVFSLGQLTYRSAALDTATRPLCQILARDIVDYISNRWWQGQ